LIVWGNFMLYSGEDGSGNGLCATNMVLKWDDGEKGLPQSASEKRRNA